MYWKCSRPAGCIIHVYSRCELTVLMQMWWLSSETEEKDDRIQQMFKQIEVKNMEAQRYKTAAEVAKVSPTIQTLAADYRVIHGTFTSLQIFDMSFNEFIAFVHSLYNLHANY